MKPDSSNPTPVLKTDRTVSRPKLPARIACAHQNVSSPHIHQISTLGIGLKTWNCRPQRGHQPFLTVNTRLYTDINALEWFCDGAREYAETAVCPKCHGAIRPLRGKKMAAETMFQCESCQNTVDYESLIDLVVISTNSSCDGIDTFSDESFVMCPCCGNETFHYGDKICYRCGEKDSCRDSLGHIILPEDMEEYVVTGECPECNHVAGLISDDD